MEAGAEKVDQIEAINQNMSSMEKGQPVSISEVADPIPDGDGKDGVDGENEEADDKLELDSFDEYSDDDNWEDEEEMDDSEIDILLEQGLPKSKRIPKKPLNAIAARKLGKKSKGDGNEPIIKKIVVVDDKGGNTFEVLPGGWIQIRHSSGMPLYLHRKTRVCTLAKPYYLGPASVRRHSIPLSGIPCLAYKRALQKEEKDKELLEEQAQALETRTEEVSSTDTPQPADFLSKCLNVTDGKERAKKLQLNAESVAEKVKMLKRKMEEDKKTVDSGKMAKTETGMDMDTAETLPSTSLQCTDITASTTPAEVAQVSFNTSECSSVNISIIEDPENQVSIQAEGNATQQVPSGNIKRNNKRGNKNMAGARSLIPLAKVETARENASLYSVAPLDLREYCQLLFKFSEVECKRFKTWSARRHHTKELKRKQLERPTLPDNAQVIKFFDLNPNKGGTEQIAKKFNDYVFNPSGKSSVCILHEFVQHALRKQPTYSFLELENATTPYSATVMINDIPYGRGLGSSKKTAKAEAAKATLEILIPQMKGHLNGNKTDPGSDFDITEYFQQVDMSDPRISKMCTSVSEPSPYTLLLTSLQRSFGKNDSSNVKFEMLPTDLTKGNPPNQFKMAAGEYTVTVNASNKREGKQLASQLLLSKMHPHISNFGAFIKMYGNGSIKSVKEKKHEEQQITTLQSKASANSPNWAILNKLRHEMLKLAENNTKDGSGSGNSDTADFQYPSANQSESDGNMSESTNL